MSEHKTQLKALISAILKNQVGQAESSINIAVDALCKDSPHRPR